MEISSPPRLELPDFRRHLTPPTCPDLTPAISQRSTTSAWPVSFLVRLCFRRRAGLVPMTLVHRTAPTTHGLPATLERQPFLVTPSPRRVHSTSSPWELTMFLAMPSEAHRRKRYSPALATLRLNTTSPLEVCSQHCLMRKA